MTQTNKEWRDARKKKGLCLRCDNTSREGFVHCKNCAISLNSASKKAVQSRKALGLCSFGCGKKAESSKVLCSTCRANVAKQQRKAYSDLKHQIVIGYGGSCACKNCPLHDKVIDDAFLTLDHVHGDGAKDRREREETSLLQVYRKLIKQGFPKDKFQLLCWNCNCARYRYNGICPHEKENK